MTTIAKPAATTTDEAPAWRCLRTTGVGHANVIHDPGCILYGERPTRANGQANHDFEPANEAAHRIANPPGHARSISPPPPDHTPPVCPFPNYTMVGVVNGVARYVPTPAAPAPEPEVEQPWFRWLGTKGAQIGPRIVEPGATFMAKYIPHHQRHLVEPLNPQAHEVLTHEFHPDPAA
jgi:hypothetical protein